MHGGKNYLFGAMGGGGRWMVTVGSGLERRATGDDDGRRVDPVVAGGVRWCGQRWAVRARVRGRRGRERAGGGVGGGRRRAGGGESGDDGGGRAQQYYVSARTGS
ncbi:hypothetical protein GUJ93_ZPchr0006g43570 [Zizania palustris]|uniref:Uncharacterized protein n=1 Tax=Zizania palustris TaxID=103762 RepID=A0A8J5VS86_ZIZPA|nr:hypothetical protein GUJ93_ZPchr0006g43570 [Zizania palustris]